LPRTCAHVVNAVLPPHELYAAGRPDAGIVIPSTCRLSRGGRMGRGGVPVEALKSLFVVDALQRRIEIDKERADALCVGAEVVGAIARG